MVNLLEFTLKSANGDRLIYISPIMLQSQEMPSLLPPMKFHLYENLIKVDWLTHIGAERIKVPKAFERKPLAIKYDMDLEKPYLGYLLCSYDEGKRWKCEENSTTLTEHDVKELETFLNNYKGGDES